MNTFVKVTAYLATLFAVFCLTWGNLIYSIDHKNMIESKEEFVANSYKVEGTSILVHNSKHYDKADEAALQMQEMVDALPENIQKRIEDKDIVLAVSEGLSLKTALASMLTGVSGHNVAQTYTQAGVAYMEVDCSYVESSFYHELGHALDGTYKMNIIDKAFAGYLGWKVAPSTTREFYDIYEAEKDSFAKYFDEVKMVSSGEYVTSTQVEYFAQAFQEYIVNPAQFKEAAPLTYDYIDNFVNSL